MCTLFALMLCVTGLPLKVLWAPLDVLSIVVLASGLYLWLTRGQTSFEARLRALEGELPAHEIGWEVA